VSVYVEEGAKVRRALLPNESVYYSSKGWTQRLGHNGHADLYKGNSFVRTIDMPRKAHSKESVMRPYTGLRGAGNRENEVIKWFE